MKIIVVEGSFTIRKGGLAEYREQAESFIKATKSEPGCVDFSLAYDVLDECRVWIVERWISCDALDRHLQSPHVEQWLPVLNGIMTSELDVRIYEAEPENFAQ